MRPRKLEVSSNINIDLSNITEADVQSVELQLSKILSSPQFKSAKQMQRFLSYIIEKTLHGETKQLKQYSIAVEALGFPDDFDSDSSPSVRILGGRVRERLTEYYKGEGIEDPIVITIPKGSYIPEIKQNTKKKSSVLDICHGESYGPRLVLACFSDKTQDIESNQLLYQISDSLAKEFSHFIFLRLAVSIPHADKTESKTAVEEVKDKYKAEYLLSLYIQQLADGKRNLLYRVADSDLEEVLWSESFEVNRGQPISEQREIIGKITSSVTDTQQGVLQVHWARKLLRTENTIPACYQALAYHRYFLDNFSRGALQKAVIICSEALERNPNSVVANVIFADYCRRDYSYGYGVIDDPLKIGLKCAETATRFKPESHEAHFALAQIYFCLHEWDRSFEEFKITRNITQYHTAVEYGTGFYFCMMGHWKEGLPLVEKAMSLSTAYPSWYHLTPFLDYYRQDKYKEALLEAQKIMTPNILHGPVARCVCYGQLGEIAKAQEELKEVLRRFPEFMEKGKHHLTCFLGSEAFAEKVWEGIIKAVDKDI